MLKMHESLKGKIKGFRVNNICIGDVSHLEPAAPPLDRLLKVAGPMNVNLYMAGWNRIQSGSSYEALDVVPPNWFSTPYSSSGISSDMTLMSYIQNLGAASYITNVVPKDGTWLDGLTFHDINFPTVGEVEWVSEDGKIVSGIWRGSAWTYFLGSPEEPFDISTIDPQSSVPWWKNPPVPPLDPEYPWDEYLGEAYPSAPLVDFLTEFLSTVEVPDNAFTLSYEYTEIPFDIRTGTENGEQVHTFVRKSK